MRLWECKVYSCSSVKWSLDFVSNSSMMFALAFILALAAATASEESCDNSDFEYFVFTELSPGGYCSTYGFKNCSEHATPNWTMHGLWPSRYDDCLCPQYCNDEYKFNLSEIEPLRTKLDRFWPSLMRGSKKKEWDESCSHLHGSEYLWCHEWSKHGTCASSVEQLNSEKKFFSEVLKLFETSMNYDTHVLSKHGIFPSTTRPYSIEMFADAFEEVWNVKPVMQCFYDKGRYVLKSIRTCMSKYDFKPMRCPDCVFKEKNCTSESVYYYPA